jgi:nickel-dependent lactate racemase
LLRPERFVVGRLIIEIELDYGKRGLRVTIPQGNIMKVLSMREQQPIADPPAYLAETLRQPIGYGRGLIDIAQGMKSACILICDITRPVPNKIILPPILNVLHKAGLRDGDILILIATGMHRPNLGDELVELVGEEIASRYNVQNHYAHDLSSHECLGFTGSGTEVWLDRRYLEADLKIATGFIEPHLMAGFSGGRKLIVPGIAGIKTMRYMHGARLLEHPLVREGIIDGNPFHEEAVEIARMAGDVFIVNVSLNERREITGIFSGDMELAHREGVSAVRNAVRDMVPEPADIVVTSAGGYPLDTTWYQSIKGLTAALPIVKDGGTIIIAAECREGIGGEEFTRLVYESSDLDRFMKDIFSDNYFIIDQWQLQELAKVVMRAHVILVSDGLTEAQKEAMHLCWSPSVEEALHVAYERHGGDASVAVIPRGPYVLADIA